MAFRAAGRWTLRDALPTSLQQAHPPQLVCRNGFRLNPVRHVICAFYHTPRKWYCAFSAARIIFGMAGKKREDVREEDVTGLKYFDKLAPLLARLHDVGCQRDKAGNRKLHFDQYCMLVLLFLVQSRGPFLAGHRASQRVAESTAQTRLSAGLAGLAQRSHRCLPAGTAQGNHRRTGRTTATDRPRSAAERRAPHADAGGRHAC